MTLKARHETWGHLWYGNRGLGRSARGGPGGQLQLHRRGSEGPKERGIEQLPRLEMAQRSSCQRKAWRYNLRQWVKENRKATEPCLSGKFYHTDCTSLTWEVEVPRHGQHLSWVIMNQSLSLCCGPLLRPGSQRQHSASTHPLRVVPVSSHWVSTIFPEVRSTGTHVLPKRNSSAWWSHCSWLHSSENIKANIGP